MQIRKEQLETVKKAFDKMPKEEVMKVQATTYKLGIMTAIRNTNGSRDFQVLAEELYKLKEGTCPVEQMKKIVEKYYDKLIKEGMVDTTTGQLTPSGFAQVYDYEVMLNPEIDKPQPVRPSAKGDVIQATQGATLASVRINIGDIGVIVDDGYIDTPDGRNVFVEWDKRPKDPLMWILEYTKPTGQKRQVQKDYRRLFASLKEISERALCQSSAIESALTEEQKRLIDKAWLSKTGLIKLTRSEQKAVKKLEKKIRKMLS